MIGGVDVFGGSERTTVEIGLGGATGAKDVVSARIAQASRVLMFMLSVLNIGDAHPSDAVLGVSALACCCCKANRRGSCSRAARLQENR